MIVYILQHPIFMVSRVPLFILYAIFSCCCDKEVEVGADYDYKDLVISFDYIEFELGRIGGNFDNHVRGLAELQFHRSVSFVQRQATIRGNQASSFKQRSGSLFDPRNFNGNLMKTIIGSSTEECTFCYTGLEKGQTVKVLACHASHRFHELCFNDYMTFLNNQGHQIKHCPICRKPIDEAAIVTKCVQIESNDQLAAEMFKIEGLPEPSPDEGELPAAVVDEPQLLQPPVEMQVPPVMAPDVPYQANLTIDEPMSVAL